METFGNFFKKFPDYIPKMKLMETFVEIRNHPDVLKYINFGFNFLLEQIFSINCSKVVLLSTSTLRQPKSENQGTFP